MSKFSIKPAHILGTSIPTLRKMGKEIRGYTDGSHTSGKVEKKGMCRKMKP